MCKRSELSPEEKKAYDAATGKSRRDRLKAAGLCVACGLPVTDGKTRCEKCRESRKEANRQYAELRRNARRVAGLCLHCGAAVVPGHAHCRPCLDKLNSYYASRVGKSDRGRQKNAAVLPGASVMQS